MDARLNGAPTDSLHDQGLSGFSKTNPQKLVCGLVAS
jgi:hypothetical protein